LDRCDGSAGEGLSRPLEKESKNTSTKSPNSCPEALCGSHSPPRCPVLSSSVRSEGGRRRRRIRCSEMSPLSGLKDRESEGEEEWGGGVMSSLNLNKILKR
jgi:hypothetical protein